MKTLHYDVAVLGGGPGGTVAAIAAARCGARTLLAEQDGYLGGALTRCGVSPMMTFHAGKTQVVRGIPQEIVSRLEKEGFSPGHLPDPVAFVSSVTPFDPEGMKTVLEDMVRESGADLLYHSIYTACGVENDKVKTVVLRTKGGLLRVEAKVFVDATADADLCADAGVPTQLGRESDGLSQPMTMMMRVSGVDSAALEQYQKQHPEEIYQKDAAKVAAAPHTGISGAYGILREAKQAGEITYNREAVLCFETNTPGEFAVNMTRVAKKSPVDPFELSQAETEGRHQAMETFRFLRKRIPGFEHCRLVSTGPEIGVRESRKIRGLYCITADDLVSNRMFPDAVSMGGYPIDLHSPDNRSQTSYRMLKPGSWYSIPYRALVPENFCNLLVAGRCVSATQEALAAIRLSPVLMAFSQGAGTAAAQAACSGEDLRRIDVGALRAELLHRGAFLTPYSDGG